MKSVVIITIIFLSSFVVLESFAQSSEASPQTNLILKECHLFEYDDPRALYIIEFAKIFENYKKNVGFEEYLKGIDYGQSEKISEYVSSILNSEEFAVMYFEKDLSVEEEKLMIQVSEKYLEYLYDGKNRLVSYIKTGYLDAKNEINSIQCKNPESLLVDRDEVLNDLEQAKTEREQAMKYAFPTIIEDWEKNLQIKKQSLQLEDSSTVEQTTEEQDSEISDFVKTGQIGVKKGDWVKYQVDVEVSGGLIGAMFENLKESMQMPETECTIPEIEWMKLEVLDIKNNNPVFQRTVLCNDKEFVLGELDDDGKSFFIPTDVNIGDVIDDDSEDPPKVIGIEEKQYGGKKIQVIKLHSETKEIYDTGSSSSSKTRYFDKTSGLLLEDHMKFDAKNVPFMGDLDVEMSYVALDYNIPRTSSLLNGGGCLIATATFGSELAPQVQMLREIRDNSLLQTQSGQSFMQGFNEFYYSFSPTIADYERQNPVFKEAVKLTITPLVASLSLLNYVDLNSEKSVLGYGISLIMLNVGMYFVAPVIVIHRIKKILNS